MEETVSVRKAKKILHKAMRKLKVKASMEVKENRVIATVLNAEARGVKSKFLTVTLYTDGICIMSAVFGHLDKKADTMLALNDYNSQSIGWRAYIDSDGDLNFDFDNFFVGKSNLKKFLIENIYGFVKDDTEKYYLYLCQKCKN